MVLVLAIKTPFPSTSINQKLTLVAPKEATNGGNHTTIMKLKYYHYPGVVSLGVLALMGIALLSPTMPNNTSAALTTTAGVAITANAEATVAISVDDQVSIDLTPTSSSTGVFNSGTSRLKVATNNTSGYAIYLGTVDETGNLAPILQGSQDKAITPVVDDTIGSSFSTNTWGYNLSRVAESGDATDTVNAANLSYNAVPSSSQTVYTTDSANLENNDEYDLTFGVNIDNTLPAGTYTNSVLVSVVANPITISELSQLTYMQDMTTSICEHTPMPTTLNGQEVTATKQLVDTRDGKKYWVAKLRDGNCWMVQNLALNLGIAPDTETEAELGKFVSKLTPADSDVEDEVLMTTSTLVIPSDDMTNPARFGAESGGVVSQTSTYSWTFGKIVAGAPNNLTCLRSPSYSSTENIVSLCAEKGYFDVADSSWKATLTAGNGSLTLPDGTIFTGFVAANSTEKTYDAHYTFGNYYQWNTATAGSGIDIIERDKNAEVSICPNGWQLPITSMTNDKLPTMYDKSFDKLLSFYGYTTDKYSTSPTDPASNNFAPMINTPDSNIVLNALHFVRAGTIHFTSGLTFIGQNADYWTGTASTSTAIFAFRSNQGTVQPMYDLRRRDGIPVRCVAR